MLIFEQQGWCLLIFTLKLKMFEQFSEMKQGLLEEEQKCWNDGMIENQIDVNFTDSLQNLEWNHFLSSKFISQ